MSKVILIDPGHGGFDPGAVKGKYKEAALNLKLAKAVYDKLKAANVNVHLTRSTDTTVGKENDKSKTLIERVKIANELNADFTLSIHHNAGGGNGAEIYTKNATPDAKNLASQIINNVVTIMGAHGDPFKTENFYIIRKLPKSALLETGFVDSVRDMERFEEYFEQLVLAVAAPLIAFAGGSKAPTVPSTRTDWETHLFKDSIGYVIDKGIMSANGNSFRPNDGITRGELAAVIHRLGLEKPKE